MKNYINSKKIALTCLLISIAITLGYFVTMIGFADVLSYGFIVGLLKPFGMFGICLIVLSAFFLLFSETIFKGWLKSIASWYLAILFILTVTTPVSSGHVMSVNRSQVVFAGMVVLALTAVVYAFWMRNKSAA